MESEERRETREATQRRRHDQHHRHHRRHHEHRQLGNYHYRVAPLCNYMFRLLISGVACLFRARPALGALRLQQHLN